MRSHSFVAGVSAGFVIIVWVALGLIFRYLVNAGTLDAMVFTVFNGIMIVMLFLVPGIAIYINSRKNA